MLYKFARGAIWLFFHMFFRIEVKGSENIPKEGNALICPNHYNVLDPLLVASNMKRTVNFMAKYELFKNPILGFLLRCIKVYPVKRGEADMAATKTTLRLLKDKQLIGIFPEGTRIKGGELGKANAGVAVFAIKTASPVIPVYISGSYKLFSVLKLKFGEPVNLVQYKKDKMTNEDYNEISQIVMEKINGLKKEA